MSLLDQFRGGEKIPAFFNKTTPAGAAVHGKITDVRVEQATEYEPTPGKRGPLMYFPDGKPKNDIIITVDTGVADSEGETRRRHHVKMYYRSDREALLAAVDATGDDDLHVGGEFAAQFLGKLTNPDGTEQGWNSHKYEYRKPSNLAAAGGSLLDKPAEAPAAQAQPILPTPEPVAPVAPVAPPAPVQQPAAPAPVVTPETATAVRALIIAGFGDAEISAAFPGVKRELIAALRNAAALAGA